MIGPDLLAAPVTADRAEADGQAGDSTPVSVYLPAGQWIDLYSGQVVQGGQTITRSASLDEIPLYMKAGTAIGFGLRSPDIWASGWNVDDLSQPGRSSYLIAPAQGQARALSSEQGSLTAVTAGASTEIHLRRAPSEAQVLVLESQTPAGITVNGRVLPRYDSTDGLRAAPEGWMMTSAPFGGVLLKLQLTDGNALLKIRYEVPPG